MHAGGGDLQYYRDTMKSFILGFSCAILFLCAHVFAEEQLSAVRFGTVIINIDVGTQYEQIIKLEHGGEEIKLKPIELWRRVILSKKTS